MANSLRRHFARFWPLYLVFGLLSHSLSSWAFSYRTRLRSEERLGVFLGAVSSDEAGIVSAAKARADATLLAVEIERFAWSDTRFATYLSAQGKTLCDIFLFPKIAAEKPVADAYLETLCRPIEGEFQTRLEALFGTGIAYYSIGSFSYGLPLDAFPDGSLAAYLTLEDERDEEGRALPFYLFFNHRSSSFGERTEHGFQALAGWREARA